MLDLRRRQLITMLSGGAVTARARRIGVLMSAAVADMEGQACIAAFHRAAPIASFDARTEWRARRVEVQ